MCVFEGHALTHGGAVMHRFPHRHDPGAVLGASALHAHRRLPSRGNRVAVPPHHAPAARAESLPQPGKGSPRVLAQTQAHKLLLF